MTKQDEIKEGVADFCRVMRAEGELRHYTPQSDADGILEFLHSQGVVIKVDRGLPTKVWDEFGEHDWVDLSLSEISLLKGMLKAGFVAVEPLIKKV